MDEFVNVRLDVSGFARDVAKMRAALENGLGTGADRAGRLIETGLARAIRSGKFGFDDLRATALSTLNEIAAATVRSGLSSLIGGGSGGGLVSLGSAVVGALTGLPGRATGGQCRRGGPMSLASAGRSCSYRRRVGRFRLQAVAGATCGCRLRSMHRRGLRPMRWRGLHGRLHGPRAQR